MKTLLILIFLTVPVSSFGQGQIIHVLNSDTIQTINNRQFHKLKKLFVVGDFDGDGKKDTVYQHIFSRLTKTEIDSSLDPFKNEWDSVAKWFYDQQADIYLTINKSNKDTLHLGTGQGLYCLLNVGDNNSDGKDKIAFVIDYCDESNVNSCKIFSLCKNKWTCLMQFGINESAFDFTSYSRPVFTEIKHFLEKLNGEWVYADYNQDSNDNQRKVNRMKRLDPDKCR